MDLQQIFFVSNIVIRRHGTKRKNFIILIYVLIDFKYGSSYDWSFEQAGITLPFSMYLPSGGDAGFDPPASDIMPVVTETWEAIKAFAANIPASRAL